MNSSKNLSKAISKTQLIVLIFAFTLNDGFSQSINDPLPDQVGVGNHASVIKSTSALIAAALSSHAANDVFRYKNVTKVEYFDGSSWVVDNTEDWKNVLDGAEGNRWNISHEIVRLTIDLGGTWIRPSAILIGQDWNAGERQYNLKVESSNDESSWSVRLNDTPTGSAFAKSIFMLDVQTEVDQYIRLTITSTTDLGDPLSLFRISGFTQRDVGLKGNSSLPFYTDFDRNIGMGTTSIPEGYKLAVDGKAIMEEIKVEVPGSWPDYVFKEDYILPSLKETKSYIKENQHLPGIPSVLEVNEEGISLGEMNAKLLEKIEELTLYVIDLKEENEALKQNQELMNTEMKKIIEKLKD